MKLARASYIKVTFLEYMLMKIGTRNVFAVTSDSRARQLSARARRSGKRPQQQREAASRKRQRQAAAAAAAAASRKRPQQRAAASASDGGFCLSP